MKILIILLVLITLAYGDSFSGKCIGISDGDTILVMRAGRATKIRVEGIDCPEKGQAFSNKAKRFTSNLVYGKIVKILIKSRDRYERIVGRVFINGTDLSYELVKNGFAWHFTRYSSEKKLSETQLNAKLNNVGLWSESNPISPWEFRKRLLKRKRVKSTFKTNSNAKIYWLNSKSNVRHNFSCIWYQNTKYGRMCTQNEGQACGICGG